MENDGEGSDPSEQEAASESWFTDDGAEDEDASFKDYDITSSPNDFNVSTIVSFIDAGPFKIPGFQRNYVWDLKRASKLIESILIGLPVPQVFLYEEAKNSFLVIDGQQRLMSIYYFAKGRFPKRARRPEIRRIISENGKLPEGILQDDHYFEKFNLSLPATASSQRSRFHGKNYGTLGDDKGTFDLRTVRNVIIKQTAPKEEDDTSVFEIFNRLNTGGVNLRAQEIRASLYHSTLMDRLAKINLNADWRKIIGQADPDLHSKDIEVLLRVLALTAEGGDYAEPIARFLSSFARRHRKLDDDVLDYIEALFNTFFASAAALPVESFRVERSNRFSIAVFEAVFRAVSTPAFEAKSLDVKPINAQQLAALKSDKDFILATREGIGRASHVRTRYERAKALLVP
jgi:hypothetical protein